MFSDINYNQGGEKSRVRKKRKKRKFLIDIPAHSKRKILVFTVQEGGGKRKTAVIFSTHPGKSPIYRLGHMVQNQVFIFFYLCQFTSVHLCRAIRKKNEG